MPSFERHRLSVPRARGLTATIAPLLRSHRRHPRVDQRGSSFTEAGGGQVGGEVGGSEVVGGLHHHRRLANPAGLLRRTPVSTQTPCSAGRAGKSPPKSSHRSFRILACARVASLPPLRCHRASAWCACPISAARLAKTSSARRTTRRPRFERAKDNASSAIRGNSRRGVLEDALPPSINTECGRHRR